MALSILFRFFACSVIIAAVAARADEGVWLFTNPPLKQLKEKYHFEPTSQWLQDPQKSNGRFNSGGRGSVGFPDGLPPPKQPPGGRSPLKNHNTKKKNP